MVERIADGEVSGGLVKVPKYGRVLSSSTYEGNALFFGLMALSDSWSKEWEIKFTLIIEEDIIEEEAMNFCDVKNSKSCVSKLNSFVSKHLLDSILGTYSWWKSG
jgi:hypothetical protein